MSAVPIASDPRRSPQAAGGLLALPVTALLAVLALPIFYLDYYYDCALA